MLEAGLRPDGDARRFRLPFRRAQGFGGGAAVGAHQPAGAELGAAEVADDADDDMVQVLSFDGAQDRLAGGAAGLAAVAEAVLAADAVGPAQVRGVRVAGHGGAQALKGGVWRVGARGVGDENRFFDGVLVAGGGFEGGDGFHGRLARRRQGAGRRRLDFPEVSGGEAVQRPFADAPAQQAQGGEADRRGHAARLAVAAFAQGQLDPASRDGGAPADRRLARPQAGRLFD